MNNTTSEQIANIYGNMPIIYAIIITILMAITAFTLLIISEIYLRKCQAAKRTLKEFTNKNEKDDDIVEAIEELTQKSKKEPIATIATIFITVICMLLTICAVGLTQTYYIEKDPGCYEKINNSVTARGLWQRQLRRYQHFTVKRRAAFARWRKRLNGNTRCFRNVISPKTRAILLCAKFLKGQTLRFDNQRFYGVSRRKLHT